MPDNSLISFFWAFREVESFTLCLHVFTCMNCVRRHVAINPCLFLCSMINKNAETKIAVQPECKQSKEVCCWLLPPPQFEMVILPPGMSEWDCVWELSPPILYSSLGLWIKACTSTTQVLWQTSVATGIKGVCPHCLVSKADQGGCFILWTSGQLYLLAYKWNITTLLSASYS